MRRILYHEAVHLRHGVFCRLTQWVYIIKIFNKSLSLYGRIIIKREYTDYQIQRILQTPYISSTILEKELGIPASTIRSFRNKNNAFAKYKLGYVEKEDFIKKYNELKSQQKMAKYYHVSSSTIRDFSKLIGFDDSIYKKEKLSDDQIRYIIENYHNKSTTLISKELNITESSVSGVFHRYGLKGKIRRAYTLDNENYFETIDTQDKAYFLGFIGADGCLYKPKSEYNKQRILRICIQERDVKVLQLLKDYLKTDKPISTETSNNRKYVVLEISSNKIFDDIEKLGLSTNKTYKNTIANIPNEFMPALIRGYFDGDGSIGNNKLICDSNISIVGYESNLLKIQNYLLSKNIYSTVNISKSKKYAVADDGSKFATLLISNNTSKYSFIKLIYENSNNVYLDRKYERCKKFTDVIENSENIRDKQIVNYYKYAVQKVS